MEDRNMELNTDEIEIIKFWVYSCEDKSLDTWGEFCRKCPLKKRCLKLQSKLGIPFDNNRRNLEIR